MQGVTGGATRSGSLRGLIVSLVLVVAGSGALAGPVMGAARHPSAFSFLEGAWRTFPALRSLTSSLLSSSVDMGSDGRLTVLVVGSDYRYTRNIGERTDAVLVATINPQTQQIAAVSIPRDTGNLPLPDSNDTYHGKVNSLFAHYKHLTLSRSAALDKMRLAIAYALQIEIDYVVFARFPGFDGLVDAVNGVYVDIPAEIRDTRIYDHTGTYPGAKFLAGTNVLEEGASATPCHATAKPINWNQTPDCHHALIYVRSRHGTVGTLSNSDWKRDARQQKFLFAAVARVINQGNGAFLTGLRDTAQGMASDFYTTLPIGDDGSLLALFALFDGAQDVPLQSAVFKPNTYAYHVPGTRRYELKLPIVRALTASWFAPVP